mmetsp:Transcript_22668/g.57744  ORF Transcript_22668/g.57744 Transcript_22668/m.57744 type:complete len:245 (-) Transcript_22668:187-921(-)
MGAAARTTMRSPTVQLAALGAHEWLSSANSGHSPRWPLAPSPRAALAARSCASSPYTLSAHTANRASRATSSSVSVAASPPAARGAPRGGSGLGEAYSSPACSPASHARAVAPSASVSSLAAISSVEGMSPSPSLAAYSSGAHTSTSSPGARSRVANRPRPLPGASLTSTGPMNTGGSEPPAYTTSQSIMGAGGAAPPAACAATVRPLCLRAARRLTGTRMALADEAAHRARRPLLRHCCWECS